MEEKTKVLKSLQVSEKIYIFKKKTVTIHFYRYIFLFFIDKFHFNSCMPDQCFHWIYSKYCACSLHFLKIFL